MRIRLAHGSQVPKKAPSQTKNEKTKSYTVSSTLVESFLTFEFGKESSTKYRYCPYTAEETYPFMAKHNPVIPA